MQGTITQVKMCAVIIQGVPQLVPHALRILKVRNKWRCFALDDFGVIVVSIVGRRFTLKGLVLLCEHGDDVFLDHSDQTLKLAGNTHNFIVFNHCLVHEILAVDESAVLKIVHFITDPLCPCLRLEDFSIHVQQMLELFDINKGSS